MKIRALSIAIVGVLSCGAAVASSHREAPLITETPKVDATDLYAFRSYESGRAGFVTLIANYLPGQAPHGGPNYYFLDPDALYDIHVDNDGDAREDLTFRFKFHNEFQNRTLRIGGVDVPIPTLQYGPITPVVNDFNTNLIESYTVSVIRGTADGSRESFGASLRKPLDNIGTKTIPGYAAYADSHIYDLAIPGCAGGRVFVGQRKESFKVALGKVFDLINLNPLGPRDAHANALAGDNITSLAVEVPSDCLASRGDPVIGVWTTSKLQERTTTDTNVAAPYTQRSRLGNPLVNELVIGLADKDRFNASQPADDAQFAVYVTNPTFPRLVEILFPAAVAPTQFPRADLVSVYLTGVAGLNKPANGVPSEMLRLNTAIAPKGSTEQNDLGVLAGDTAGFPNGRRPGDDIVDITLRAAQGALLPIEVAPAKNAPLTDGVAISARDFDTRFPYLTTPLAGSGEPAAAPAGARPAIAGIQ